MVEVYAPYEIRPFRDPDFDLGALRESTRRRFEHEVKPAHLNRRERRLWGMVRETANNYFQEKLAKYSETDTYDPSKIDVVLSRSLPSSKLNLKSSFMGYHRKGAYPQTVVFKRNTGDLLEASTVMFHELSHAVSFGYVNLFGFGSTNGETAFVANIRTGLSITTIKSSGEVINTGQGIDNGLSVYDQANLYWRVRHLFPKEVVKRQEYMQTAEFKEAVTSINIGSNLPILERDVEPFIIFRNGKPLISSQLAYFILIQNLAFSIGHNTISYVSADEKIQLGLDILEKTRYTGGPDAFKTIKSVLDPEVSKTVLQILD